MKPQIITGNIIEQEVEVIVNSWNQNIIPWWLLFPQGVSAAIKRQGGLAPFREIAKFGPIPLGDARLTSAGNLPYKGVIHVAGINLVWIATEYSVVNSVVSTMNIVHEKGYRIVAFPLIGSGSGNKSEEWSLKTMLNAFDGVNSPANVIIVKYDKES